MIESAVTSIPVSASTGDTATVRRLFWTPKDGVSCADLVAGLEFDFNCCLEMELLVNPSVPEHSRKKATAVRFNLILKFEYKKLGYCDG